MATSDEILHHECGHIVMGYDRGFRVNRMRIDANGGVTEFDYGDNSIQCTVLNHLSKPQIFESFGMLPSQVKPEVALNLLFMFIAGPIAEAIFRNDFDENGQMVYEESGTDLERSKNIYNFLKEHYAFNQSYTTILCKMIALLKGSKFQNAILSLVNKFNETEGSCLSRSDIEDVMKEVGVLKK